MNRRLLLLVLTLALMALAAPPGTANDDYAQAVAIGGYRAPVFLYGGSSYVPLRSTASFLGAALLWDSVEGRALVTYNGRELGLVLGSTTAYLGGRGVVLPAAPLLLGDQVLVPVTCFGSYLGVPVRWDGRDDRVLLRSGRGWGYYPVSPYPPPAVVTVLGEQGPPPWAPAHGWRRKHWDTGYVPASFVYGGATYVPLRDLTSLVGAALLWDSLRGRAVLTYDGRNIGLVVGSPVVYDAGRVYSLAAPPLLVGGLVYVPADLCTRSLGVPVRRAAGVLQVKGPSGWTRFRIASRPPGLVRTARVTRLAKAYGPAMGKGHGAKAWRPSGGPGRVKAQRVHGKGEAVAVAQGPGMKRGHGAMAPGRVKVAQPSGKGKPAKMGQGRGQGHGRGGGGPHGGKGRG